jgi:uncharacterized protein (TIRG00374 family)
MIEERIKNNFINNVLLKVNKKIFIFLVKLVIAIGLLFYLIYSVNINEIINAVRNANVTFILFALILLIPNIYLQFSKWKLTSNLLLQQSDNKKIWLSLFYGLSAGVFTPARVGEYFGRAIAFKDKSVLTVTLATLLDKIYLLILVTFFGTLSSLLFIHFRYNVSNYIVTSLFIVIFVIFYLLFMSIFSSGFWQKFIIEKIKNSDKLKGLFEKINISFTVDKSYSTKMLMLSFLLYVCFLLQYALLVAAFSGHLNLMEYIWAGNLLMFAKTIIPPISFGELGIREGASIFFITQLGETASVGFNASILLFLINILLPSLVGLILLLKKNDD